MTPTREAVFSALFARLSGLAGFATKSRMLRHFNDVPAEEQPALFQIQKNQGTEPVRGLPSKWTLRADVFIYCRQPDEVTPSSVTLNGLLDAVENALAPDAGPVNDCTLGGLVSKCRIAGEIEIFEGVADNGQAVAVIPVEIITT